jgi:hypothetical protein
MAILNNISVYVSKLFHFRALPAAFQHEVLTRCFVTTSGQQDGHLLEEMLSDGISEERLVHILGQSLPRIIPNVILNKREVCRKQTLVCRFQASATM